MTASPPRPADLVPALTAATAFSFADVATKVVFNAGADVLTQTLFRGLFGLPLLMAFAALGARPKALAASHRNLALLIGVLFAANIYFLFLGIQVMEVPVAILIYFTYPLLTGIAAALFGLERLGFAGALAAMAAFVGLALIVGAHPGGVAIFGLAGCLLGSASRVIILLVTRMRLGGADPRLTSVWSMLAATVVFAAAALLTSTWQPPATMTGWLALFGSSAGMAVAVYCMFLSTARIGAFRTALFMNLEPLLATAGAAVVLGEVITPLQALGGAIMIAALVAFQMRR